MKKITLVLVICVTVLRLEAAVITDSNILLGSGSIVGAEYALTVYQDEAATDPTSIFFNFSGGTLSIVSYNVDEASDWYLVSNGDQFNQSNIAEGDFPVFIRHTPAFQTNDVAAGAGFIYLGVNTGNLGGGPFPPRNIFGWARFFSTGDELFMSGNAVSYDNNGIIVGAPEPSAAALVFLAFLGLFSGIFLKKIATRQS